MNNKRKSIEQAIYDFEDKYNPLKMYCYLRDCGMQKDEAIERTKNYGNLIYAPMIEKIKELKKRNFGE